MPLARLERDELNQLEKSLTREWIETDGVGGYASSTALLCPTRRHHALLAGSPPGIARRHVFLTRFEETLHGSAREFPLSIARYAGVFAPHGHQGLERFELVPWPRFHYRIGDAVISREILLPRGRQTVLVRWRLQGAAAGLELRLRPLLAFRDADALTFENLALDPRCQRLSNGFRVQPYSSLPPLWITTAGARAQFEADPVWYRGIEYTADKERGCDAHEDNFSPGVLHVHFDRELDFVVAASIALPVEDPALLFRTSARERSAELQELGREKPVVTSVLARSADHFLYQAPGGRAGVVAGWPGFGEGGRDSFISLPGLLLSRGLVARCGDALEAALPWLDRGLMPQVFGPTRAESQYGAVDASLWFARCVLLWQRAGGERERLLERFLPALREVAWAYRNGTSFGIRCDASGLLRAGSPEQGATWMDARTAVGPVTPRHGYAVEVNALWYQLIAHLEELLALAGDAPARASMAELRARVGHAFFEHFWLADERYLADRFADGVPDPRVRPNMVIAAALEKSPLSRSQRADVVARAEAELLTPRGLRSLSPQDPEYQGHCEGGPDERGIAYHQGSVWPWLLGFYCEAALRASGPSPELRARIESLLAGFEEHLFTQGLCHVSEFFDGDPPHRPGGCIAQAWSTAELLRAAALLRTPVPNGNPS
jgi:predicted glycogen debranching enzyme